MKQKILCLAAFSVCVLSVRAACADTNFTVEPLLRLESKTRPNPSVDGTISHTFDNSKFGVSGFWWVMQDWAEFHGGPTYSPVKQLTLSLDFGAEQDGHGNLQARYATGFSLTPNDVWAFSGMVEANTNTFRGNTSGVWYDVLATATPPDAQRLTVGGRAQRFVGIGPFVQLNAPELHSKLWLLWAAADPEKSGRWPFSSGLLGLTLGF